MASKGVKIYLLGLWLLLFWAVSGGLYGQNWLAYNTQHRSLLHEEPINVSGAQVLTSVAAAPAASAVAPSMAAAANLAAVGDLYAFEDCFVRKRVHERLDFPLRTQRSAPIPRLYYSENLFDIDDVSNPFALRRQRTTASFTAAGKEQVALGERISSAWSEIMGLNNPNQEKGSPIWLSFVIFGLLGLVAMQVSLFRKELFETFHAFANGTVAGQVFRAEQGMFANAANALSTSIYSGTMGIFVFLLAQQNAAAGFNTLFALLLSVAGVGALYFAKWLQIRFLAWLLPHHGAIDFYGFIVANTNKVIGIALVPFILFMAYSPPAMQPAFLYTALAVLALAYLYRQGRALGAVSDILQAHKIPFAVYVLTAEVAPILIALKLLAVI